MAISRFHKGSSTFKCDVCGRGTRHTGVQSMGMKICPQCFDLAGIENEISDGYCTLEERTEEVKALVADVATKGGDIAEWVVTFNLGAGEKGGR